MRSRFNQSVNSGKSGGRSSGGIEPRTGGFFGSGGGDASSVFALASIISWAKAVVINEILIPALMHRIAGFILLRAIHSMPVTDAEHVLSPAVKNSTQWRPGYRQSKRTLRTGNGGYDPLCRSPYQRI